MKKEIKNRLSKIQLVALDFDGIFTDGFVYVDQGGREMVRCSRKDGLGIDMLKREGIDVCVISKETNPVVAARCRKLNIPCWQSVEDGDEKLEILKRIITEKGLTRDQVVYMGDDLNDQASLEYAGIGVTVADAHPCIQPIADYMTDARGGEHAVREVAEMILDAKGKSITY